MDVDKTESTKKVNTDTLAMRAHVAGRVKSTKLTYAKSLWPLFEAISNSIHAINDLEDKTTGSIEIVVERDSRQETAFQDESYEYPIVGFSIKDNGVGFNKENLESFACVDSPYKEDRGGKGLGRFSWLKAHDSVNVDSVYKATENNLRRVSFDFSVGNSGISNLIDIRNESEANSSYTIVSLIGYKDRYQQACPKEIDTIAGRILNHFMYLFIMEGMPAVTIRDSTNFEWLSINKLFKEQVADSIEKSTIRLSNNSFELSFVKQTSLTNSSNEVRLCGNFREVESEALSKLVPQFPDRLTDDKGEYYLLVYVTGQYLDSHLNQERTGIEFFSDEELFPSDLISRKALLDTIAESVAKRFNDEIAIVQSEHLKKLGDHIRKNAPRYRALLRSEYESRLSAVPVGASGEILNIELFKVHSAIEAELMQKTSELTNSQPETREEAVEMGRKVDEYLAEHGALATDALAAYIVHRKCVIDLFRQLTGNLGPNGYGTEAQIHDLICPMRASSNDRFWLERQNLWLLDERLTHHLYLASDKPLASLEDLKIDSANRPDLLVLSSSSPMLFAEDRDRPSAGVVVEFKKPGRRNSDGPLAQALKYVEEIRSGKRKDATGHEIKISNIPFDVFVIADLSSDVELEAKNFGLKQSDDKQSWYGYPPNYSAYCEVISFRKILDNAEKRNRVLFEKLGL